MGTIAKAGLTAIALLVLQGCVARALVDVATAPVRVAGKAVDLATTSQSEADEKRGRALRQREERLGRLDRAERRYARECVAGDSRACALAERTRAEIEATQSHSD